MSNQRAELLSRKQAAEYLNTTPGPLNYWASTGKHNLPYYRMGAKAVYKRAELDAWLEERKVGGAAK